MIDKREAFYRTERVTSKYGEEEAIYKINQVSKKRLHSP